MENEPTKEKYGVIGEEIIEMAKLDQEMRKKNNDDREYWDEEVDKKNTERMKEIIAQIGWPTISKVGEVASDKAWLLVQHADHDAAFQRQCLDLMKNEPKSEVLQENIAYLEDRVLLKEVGYQIYGTQFDEKDDEFFSKPIKDLETVDERRKAMGLDTLAENLARMYERYGRK